MQSRIATTSNARLLAALALVGSGLAACEPLVDVNVTLIEPCNQSDTALSGVATYQVSHDGPGDTNAVLLTKSGGSEPLVMRSVADDVTITVQGYLGDVSQDPAVTNGDPQAIGRSLPLDIGGTAPDMDIVIPMGLVDSFGQATDAAGVCTFSQNGEAVAGRHAHTATYLPSENKVLIVGGALWVEQNGVRGESFLRSAELFDPATGTFEALPDMPNTRGYHTATALPDGRVLIAGGFGVIGGQIDALTNGLLYTPNDPSGNVWTPVPLRSQRALHTATLLADQQLVLLIGGCAGEGCLPGMARDSGDGIDPTAAPKLEFSIEVYDIANDEIIAQPNVMTTTRAMHAASALVGGRVLVSGGVNTSGVVCDIEVFQTNGTSVSPLAAPGVATFSSCPVGHTQITLGDSRVMFIGGQTVAPGGVTGAGPGVSTVQFWNTTVGIETLTAAMLSGRTNHASTLLDDGSVLVVGGTIAAGGATAERLVPQGETYMHQALEGTPLQSARSRLAIAPLPNNQVVVVGGQIDLPAGPQSSDLVEIYYGR